MSANWKLELDEQSDDVQELNTWQPALHSSRCGKLVSLHIMEFLSMTVVRTQREDLRNVGIRFAAEQRLWNVRDGGRTVIIVALELLLENSPDPAHPLDLVKLMNLVRRHGGKETDPLVGVAVMENSSQSR